jgi:hypothetical protein
MYRVRFQLVVGVSVVGWEAIEGSILLRLCGQALYHRR